MSKNSCLDIDDNDDIDDICDNSFRRNGNRRKPSLMNLTENCGLITIVATKPTFAIAATDSQDSQKPVLKLTNLQNLSHIANLLIASGFLKADG